MCALPILEPHTEDMITSFFFWFNFLFSCSAVLQIISHPNLIPIKSTVTTLLNEYIRKHGTISEGKSFTTNTGKIRYNQSGLAKQAIQLGLIGFECFFEELQVIQSSCFKMNGENSTNKTSKQHGPWTTLNSNKVFHANYLDDLNAATQKHVNVII